MAYVVVESGDEQHGVLGPLFCLVALLRQALPALFVVADEIETRAGRVESAAVVHTL